MKYELPNQPPDESLGIMQIILPHRVADTNDCWSLEFAERS